MIEEVVLKDEDGVVVVRVGSTVRRAAGPWTATVQLVLNHLTSTGFVYAPAPLGVDEHGRDTVAYIEGESGPACWPRIATDEGLWRFGRLLGDYHQSVTSFVAPEYACWKLPVVVDGPDTLVCHGDFAPWNIVWRGDEPVGIIDWEFARPGNRFDDLAWAAIWSVPLRSDEEAVHGWDCWREPPDRPRRFNILIDGYGAGTTAALVDRAASVLRGTFADVLMLAAQGNEPQRSWVRSGIAQHDLDRADWIEANRHSLTELSPNN